MAEDEGVNGDLWTAEASRFLAKLGWIPISDNNIDVEDENKKARGLDGLFKYEDGYGSRLRQGVFVEAKRYATTSFKQAELNTWVSRLADKVLNLKNSETLFSKFPDARNLELDTGLIAIWFHDLEKYKEFRSTFLSYLQNVKVPKGLTRTKTVRVLVIDNEKILQLASMIGEIEKWKAQSNTRSVDELFLFHYSSSGLLGNPVRDLPVVNVEYLMSDFIFAKGKIIKGKSHEAIDVVFYFGELDENSFNRLAEAIVRYEMSSNKKKLVVYKYRRELPEFRKIETNIEKLFAERGANVEFRNMDVLGDLPAWMTQE